jgi:hypothetical protein
VLARPWPAALVVGAGFGVFTGAQWALTRSDPVGGLAVGVISALWFGPVMAVLGTWHARRVRPVLDALPAGRRRAAKRAAWRGPVPADPGVRDAARELATQHLDLVTILRPWAFLGAGLLGVLGLLGGILLDPLLAWIGLAVAALLAVIYLVQGVRLPRRVAALRGAGEPVERAGD